MPRSGRGGSRNGTPGQTYANRTDLNGPPKLPIETAEGQPYGVAAQQQQAQRAVPMAQAPSPPPPPISSAPSAPQQGAAPPPAGAPAAPPVTPGSMGAFDRPTERPNEPVTAGLPTGAGPGPEALGPTNDPLVRMAAVLNLMGPTADPQTASLRSQVNATLANRALP